MIEKVDVPWSLPVTPHELLIPGGPFRLGVTRQHTLDADTDALDVVHGAPALRVQQIEADDAVGVDVRVQGDAARRGGGRREEDDFRGFDRVRGRKVEAEAEVLVRCVQRVVGHGEVHVPLAQVVRGDERYAGREAALDLCGRRSIMCYEICVGRFWCLPWTIPFLTAY
nr:hypothetical protein CFP56_50336 [Quercus suber]